MRLCISNQKFLYSSNILLRLTFYSPFLVLFPTYIVTSFHSYDISACFYLFAIPVFIHWLNHAHGFASYGFDVFIQWHPDLQIVKEQSVKLFTDLSTRYYLARTLLFIPSVTLLNLYFRMLVTFCQV